MAKNNTLRKTPSGLLPPASPPDVFPWWFAFPLLLISLAVPNLVFSGTSWFDTLHLMKWAVTAIPVALLWTVGGARVAWYGADRTRFRVDAFAGAWFFVLLYFAVQPLWVPITSGPTLVKEWFFVATMLGVYLVALNEEPERWRRDLRWILLAAALNGAVNVVFAELQMRNLVTPDLFFILNTPGFYIGNTGYQNMMGLWMFVGAYGMCWCFLTGAFRREDGTHPVMWWVALGLLAVDVYGLAASTSRSAFLAFLTGLLILGVAFWAQAEDRRRVLKRVLLFTGAFFLAYGVAMMGVRGADVFFYKFGDMVVNYRGIGGRSDIWTTSWTMVRQSPWRGVGLGHFKWRYLDAQRETFRQFPDNEFQYTNWAHNEYLQWFAEGGIIGGTVLSLLVLWWLWRFSRALVRRQKLSPPAVWACGFVTSYLFAMVWDRPLHRIEDAVWLALALGISARELFFASEADDGAWARAPFLRRFLGGLGVVVALGGLWFLGDGMAGDKLLARSLRASNAQEYKSLVERARKHPMVRLDADRQLALLYIRAGESSQNGELLLEGLNRLTQYFYQESTAEDLMILLDWAQRLQSREMLEQFTSYLKPGSYQILSAPAQINASPESSAP